MKGLFKQQRWLVPEVVQTSAMDCGPASLKCLLEGFGIPVSYGRLREACQTDIDGTSIDTMEEIANQLGLRAEQVMLPPDHLLIPEAEALPAIVVTQLPNGLTHFIVVWQRHGNLVQVMDPASGRRWISTSAMQKELYIHTTAIPADGWRTWAGSQVFLKTLRRRLTGIGIQYRVIERLIDGAALDSRWQKLAALDAATRMLVAIARGKGLRPGSQATKVLEAFVERAWQSTSIALEAIPANFWSVRPATAKDENPQQLLMRGAVLVWVAGRSANRVMTSQLHVIE